MPVEIKNDKSKDLTIVDVIGDVSLDEIFDTIRQYIKSGISKYELYDFQKYTGPHFGFEEIRSISDTIPKMVTKRPEGSKTALVWSESDLVGFGISRQVIALLEVKNVNFEMNVFYSLDDALEWLGIRM